MLPEFADLHGLVDGKGGVANGGACGRWQVPRSNAEVGTGAVYGVGVAVAFGAGHGERAGGDQVSERGTLAVESDVAALGVGNGEQVTADAGEADGLRRGSAGIGGRELLEREGVEAEKRSRDYHEANQCAHEELLRQA